MPVLLALDYACLSKHLGLGDLNPRNCCSRGPGGWNCPIKVPAGWSVPGSPSWHCSCVLAVPSQALFSKCRHSWGLCLSLEGHQAYRGIRAPQLWPHFTLFTSSKVLSRYPTWLRLQCQNLLGGVVGVMDTIQSITGCKGVLERIFKFSEAMSLHFFFLTWISL